MITVTVKDKKISMSGHACRKDSSGIDRACAAVSALTCNLINSLRDLTGDRIRADTGSGMMVIEWENLSDGGKLLIDSWFLGLTDINRESNEIIQGVIAQSAVLSRGRKLANMTSKQYKMPVLDMLPIAYFVNGDSGQKKTTKQAWDKKFIIAEEIAVIVPIPEAVLDDSQYDIWGEVKPRVTEAFGNKVDGAVLFGTDKPSTWRDDVVATATKAGSVVTLGSADPLYDKIMAEDGVIAKVENCGYMVNGHMADISMRAKLRGLKNANGDPLFKADMQGSTQYALDGSPMNFPNNGSFDKTKALMISGDFSQLVYSIRQDITFKLFTEGVVQNTDGSIAYNLMQNDMVALRAVMRLGWEIPNPINALAKDKTKRCPFSILKAGE